MTVSYTGDPQNVIEELITDGDGRTETLDLATPPLEYSLEPNVNQPYSEYTVKVEAEGYELVEVTGSELLSGEQSVQQVDLKLAEGAAFADVDWYVKAEDIVLKNKGNQNAGSPQNHTPQGQPKK